MTCSSALFQQQIFKRSQRARDAPQSFNRNQCGAYEVAGPEREVSDPRPRKEQPEQNGKKPEKNKASIGKVDRNDKIGKPCIDQSPPFQKPESEPPANWKQAATSERSTQRPFRVHPRIRLTLPTPASAPSLLPGGAQDDCP